MFETTNHQRRHLYPHWDNAAAHGLQFHLPFFDSRFLERALTIPVDWTRTTASTMSGWGSLTGPLAACLGKRIPGSSPVPYRSHNRFRHNGRPLASTSCLTGKHGTAPLADVLATRPFPEILNRNYLRYVRVRRRLGGDHGYAVAAARKVRDIWVRSDGRFEWR